MYRGEVWRVEINPSISQSVLKNTTSNVLTSGVNLVGEARVRWYKSEAAFFLKPRVSVLAREHNLTFAKVSTREARRRWGSCSSRGNISLNCKLIMSPEWVSDAIILHELAHTIHHNHSKRFWGKLLEICPQWKDAAKWLEENYIKMERSWCY